MGHAWRGGGTGGVGRETGKGMGPAGFAHAGSYPLIFKHPHEGLLGAVELMW